MKKIWLVVLLIIGLAAAVGVPAVRRSMPPPNEISRGPLGHRRVAITFDAGGRADGLPELLDSLDAAHIRSTFFLTGEWTTEHADLAREIHFRGHEIGNHSWSHRDLTDLDEAQVRVEILRTDALLKSVTGVRPRPLFRAPCGARDNRLLRILDSLGYFSIYWTLDSLDSIAPQKTSDFLIARVAARSDAELDGAIILMHVGEPSTVQALGYITRNLQRRDFQLGTVGQLLQPAGQAKR